MNTKTQLLQSIQETEEQLNKLKQQLNNYKAPTIQDANVGDTLEDGCVVVARYEDSVLIAAPAITEVLCKWTPEFPEVFESLKSQGFISAQWYVPSQKELKLAHKNCKNQFSSTLYWSSTEFSSANAYTVSFLNGRTNCLTKTLSNCVRAFRRVAL